MVTRGDGMDGSRAPRLGSGEHDSRTTSPLASCTHCQATPTTASHPQPCDPAQLRHRVLQQRVTPPTPATARRCLCFPASQPRHERPRRLLPCDPAASEEEMEERPVSVEGVEE
jgi:hypothetical protein